ncbi:TetR/AcrR family transcriptional regulator [Luteimonas salinilitoris]|uniref:TetR/AcrR family transcriptional regulator n=1 Tax=Luteimonas salinilitoris TaxID=3237697 RepID=A0ABV4HSP6_9GAMM
MTRRPYASPARAAAAAEKRDEVVRSAAKFLREQDIARFSLDAVAKAAGVTRLTVYNQFGSRRGLFEAVFDEIARTGGLTRLPHVIAVEDPVEALKGLVDAFCHFWGSDAALGRLFDAIGLDPEFGEALLARNELRRGVLGRLVGRMHLDGVPATAKRDAIDLMFTLTSYPAYRLLAASRSDKAIRRIVKEACLDAVDRLRRTSTK